MSVAIAKNGSNLSSNKIIIQKELVMQSHFRLPDSAAFFVGGSLSGDISSSEGSNRARSVLGGSSNFPFMIELDSDLSVGESATINQNCVHK